MSITIAVRSEQFGDTQLTSDHFNTNISYASFTISSSDNAIADGAVANINDLAALASQMESDNEQLLTSLGFMFNTDGTYDTTDDFVWADPADNGNGILLSSVGASSYADLSNLLVGFDAALNTAELTIAANTQAISDEESRALGVEASLQQQISANDNDILNLQTELDATQTSLGFNDTQYPNNAANYIAGVSVTADIALLDTNLKSLTDLLSADLSTLEQDVEARLGIADISDAQAFEVANSGYLQAAASVLDALTKLDAGLGSEVTRATNAETNLQNAIDAEETRAIGVETSIQNELDATQLSIFGQDTSTYNSNTNNTHATNNVITSDIDSLDAAIVQNTQAISNLGSAFEYVAAIDFMNGGNNPVLSTAHQTLATAYEFLSANPNGGNANALASQITQKEAGDYYKITGVGAGMWITDGTSAYFVKDGDSIVFNKIGSFDHFDNSDASIVGENNFIDASLGANDQYTISINQSFKNRVSTAETEIDALETFTGIGAPLDTAAIDLATAINELHGEINSNDTDIAQLRADLTTEISDRQQGDNNLQTQIDANKLASDTADADLQAQISLNDTDIANLQANQLAIETSVGLPASGTKTDFDSDGNGNTNFITASGTFKDAIEELDAALQVSQTVDTGRLTFAPMTHQYVAPTRLTMGGDLEEYASVTFEGNGTNGYSGAVTSGVIRRGEASASFLGISGTENGYVVLGSFLSNAPSPNHSASKSHLVSNLYWNNTRVYKNGVRLFQRSSFPVGATLSADQYTVVAVTYSATYNPNGNATTWAELTSDSTISVRRYPAKIPYYIESTYRHVQSGNLGIGAIDPDAGQPHPLAGQVNTDAGEQLNDPVPAQLIALGAHGNAGDIVYYKIEFGGVLDEADVIVVDYMGSTN